MIQVSQFSNEAVDSGCIIIGHAPLAQVPEGLSKGGFPPVLPVRRINRAPRRRPDLLGSWAVFTMGPIVKRG